MYNKFLLKGRQRSMMLVSLFLLAVATFAVPAKPGLTRLLTLTDGTTLNATLVGDEYVHYWLGTDGKAYRDAGDDVYQSFDPQSAKKSGDERRSSANYYRSRRLAPRKVGGVGSITGQKKGLIILVNFDDVTFNSANDNALYQRIANERNFTYTINSDYSFKGSMCDYFYDQSEGQFELTFDIVGPVKVSQKQAYYGKNDRQGNDEHPAEMVIEALKLADPHVNYANYDWDGDDIVEQVYVVYAGKGEADGGAASTIWPHEWTLSSANYYGDGDGAQTLDGVTIDTYACGGELNGQTGLIAGIGTMCHEFSHCLGYPDFYDTDYSGGQGMGYWDLMCDGSYNNDGYQPAGYTSYERWVAGWKTPEELVYTQDISNMAALQTLGSKTYVIYNKGHRDEYYLLENRQKTKWDASLPGKGLLILHVDYNSSVWSNNQPNDDTSHQRMTWVAADNNYQYTTYQGTKYYTFDGMANDPFPYGSVNAFGKNTTPAATLYNNNSDGTKYLDSSVENITQKSDGTISFNFRGISNVVMPNISPDGGRFTNDQTVTVTITAETGATIYYTTNGNTPTTASTLYTSPFTLNATTTVKAIAVKNNEESGVATATYTFVEPLILADESLSFSTNAGSSETKTLTVLTEGLTQDVTLILNDVNNVFSLGATTISKNQEEAMIDVTFSPTAAGNYTGTITLTSAGAETVTVQLSATATIPVPTTPADLTLSEVTSTSLTASWSAVANADSYEIDIVKGSSFEASAGGAVLQADFSDTTDWTLSGTGTYTSSPYYGSGSPSIKFDGTGDYAISPDFGSGTKLQFWALGNNGSGSTFAISGLVNGTWTDIETVTIAQGSATYEVNLPDGTSQVRFDFTKRVNCALDDVIVYGPSNAPESVEGYPKSVGNVTSYAVTGLTSETQYAIRVRATNNGGNSDWSSTATTTTTTTVANSAPVWSALPTNASIILGGEYELTISDYVSGTPTPTISMTSSDSDDAYYADGYFLFEPTETGTFNFTFTATNSEGSANATLTVTVSAAQASSEDEFALVTSAADFVEGDYIIVYDGAAMNTTVSNNRLQYTAVTPTNNVITTDEASIIWHIAPNGNYYTIYNADENKYAASNGTKNQAQLLASGTDDKSLWSVTTGETFDFTNKHNAANNINATLRRNGTYGFACYASGTGGALSLYKRTGGTNPTDPTLAYYQNADGKQGEALKTAMYGIIYNRTEQRYDDLWTAFQTTDVRSDDKIWDMYSNITNYTPVNSGSTYSEEGDCYNREHSFPQSWFGSNTPMYTDLHHIYPTDGFVNGKRANYPFGETSNPTYTSANDFSKLGNCTYPGYTGIVFEPADEYKGDFARTYFYMITCYEEKLPDWYTNYSSTDVVHVIDGSTYPGFQTWQLKMLMKWAKNDPVSDKEINRNNAVYAIQNNRNPFIDYPGLEEYIWGSMTTTAFSYDNYVQPDYAVTVPELTVSDVTSNSAVASWTACDGVTEYTLQLSTNDFATAAHDVATLLSESFTNASGTSSTAISNFDAITDNKGWEGSYVFTNDGTIRISSKNNTGDIESPWLTNATAGATVTLTFDASSWTNDATTVNVTVTEDGATFSDPVSFSLNESMTAYTTNFTVYGTRFRVRWAPSAAYKRFFLDNVVVTSCDDDVENFTVSGTSYEFTDLEPETIYYARVKGNDIWSNVETFTTGNTPLNLANNGNNSGAINAAATNAGKYDVTLSDRTLYKDDEWNTICLPFDVVLDDSPLSGAIAKTLTDATMTGTHVTLTFGNDVDELEAGVPYIIKWANNADDNIVDPVFNGVTIVNKSEAERTIEMADGNVKFIGYYDAFDITADDTDIYYMTAGNKLKYTGVNRTLKSCRAYFKFTEAAAARQFVLDFGGGDVTTGIVTLDNLTVSQSDDYYDLLGRKMPNGQMKKGLYINNGKKVVIK